MCGISGLISTALNAEQRESIVSRMNSALGHRGPDHRGLAGDLTACLGHTRLSIIDLQPASNQPFHSNDNRYSIVYNGELYNFRELRLELQRSSHGNQDLPYFFKTNSDTEVVLAAFIRWGSRCLDYFNGMFAFAIYDKEKKELFLARDRFGVKPLYYHYSDKCFIFSSELRAILNSGVASFALNREVVAEYLMFQTVLAPDTIIDKIKMLMPGHFAVVTEENASIKRYYDVNGISLVTPELTYDETCTRINELMALSVQRRLVSDVPSGAFLSGGIDSSAIVGLMSQVSREKIRTFNVSFDESEFSESHYARLVAKRFGTIHHEIKLTSSDFLRQLPDALQAMDHPGGDGPNTYVVSRATREAGISMALSGIGGDELFAGYDVFRRMSELNKKSWVNLFPRFLRRTAGYVIDKSRRTAGSKKVRELLRESQINFLSAYPLNRSVFTRRELSELTRLPEPFENIASIIKKVPQTEDHLLSAVSLAEIQTYLQNTLLRDTDQMSMAVALEVREPFLDHKLVEFVLSVNDSYKFPHSPKKLLVDSLKGLLPDEIVYRKKMGFTLPWEHWLRNDLKAFAGSNIEEFSKLDIVHGDALMNLWHRFLGGDRTVTWSRIWHIVVLNEWLKRNKVSL